MTRPLIPASLSATLVGYDWARNTVGESGGEVYQLFGKPGAPDLFVKHGTGSVASDIADEAERLGWISRFIPTPVVTCFEKRGSESWLVMTALAGETAYQVLESRPQEAHVVVDAIAEFLSRIHAIPASECPFNSDHGFRPIRARERIDAGLVDEDDFDDDRAGWSAEQVWDAMQKLLPFALDPVVTHGDFSLDNILMNDGKVVGCIDVGRAGIADRYQDLAVLWNCLGEFGSVLQNRLFDQYGIATIDERKLEFHLLLDELF